MAEQRSYPEREHYDFPTTPAEVIGDEVRFCQDGLDFRRNLTGLMRFYKETRIVKAYSVAAEIFEYVPRRAPDESPPDDERSKLHFLGGAVLAAHANIYCMKPEQVSKVLNTQFLLPFEYFDPGTTAYDNARQVTLQHLSEFSTEQWQNQFEQLEPELQEQLTFASAFASEYDTGDYSHEFMLGYLHANSNIQKSANC